MAWMLVLVAIITLAGGAAVQDVLFAQQLANSRAQQQRAMGMAELGLRFAVRQLSTSEAPALDSGDLHPGTRQSDSLRVRLRPGTARMPTGASAGRFLARDYEIESRGSSAGNAQRVLFQGVTRLEPLAMPTP